MTNPYLFRIVFGMIITDAVHALILFDQKKLLPKKSRLLAASGDIYLFVRVDTKLNWPRIFVQDQKKEIFTWNSSEIRMLKLEILDDEIKTDMDQI